MLLCALTVLVSVSAWADASLTVNDSGNANAGSTYSFSVTAIGHTPDVNPEINPVCSQGTNLTYTGEDGAGTYYYSVDIPEDATGTLTISATSKEATAAEKTVSIIPKPEPSFSLAPAASTVNEGESVNFSATTQNMDGYVITWFVSPTSASFPGSNQGPATTLSFPTAGSYTVWAVASNGDKTVNPLNTCSVTVNAKTVYVTGITIDNPGTVFVGVPKTLVAHVSPSEATQKVRWESNHPEILDVNPETGELYPRQTTREPVVITAWATDKSGVSKDIYLTVSETQIRISSNNGTELSVGNTTRLTATDSDNTATGWMWRFTETWMGDYASLKSDGSNQAVVEIKKGGASVTVQATNKYGKSAAITINAQSAPSSALGLSAYNLTLPLGGTGGVLRAYYGNSDVTNYCTWTDYDPSIISVYQGKITPLKAGTTRVRAWYSNIPSEYCTVTVGGTTFFTITAVSNNATFDGVNPLYFVTSAAYDKNAYPSVTIVGANNEYSRNLVYGSDFRVDCSPDGHMMITVNPVTLHNLPQSNFHNIAVSYGGQIAYARFWRAGTSYNVYGVRTGDDNNIALWSSLCLISFAGAAAIVITKRKDIFAK